MKKIKNQTGITLIALAIMIIILLILVGVSLTYGTDQIDSSIKATNQAELQMVYNAILQEYTKMNLINNKNYIGEEVSSAEINEMESICNITIEDDEVSSFYKLTPDYGLEEIGIEDSEDIYIVNYEEGIVFNYTKQKADDGTIYYMSNQK